MKNKAHILLVAMVLVLFSCAEKQKEKNQDSENKNEVTAKEILGNPAYQAISYGGYREGSRDIQPTIVQLKEDMKILYGMGIRILRTYNVHLPHAASVLKAINELKNENPDFEMYVMLGAWIDCKNAWTDQPVDHSKESPKNAEEIDRAVALAKQYPEIVKVIAVGNEAMVHWAGAYFVEPWVILKWVNHLQELKKKGELPGTLWITSSDDFSSWGGGDPVYHTEDLVKLIKAVDYVSMHTYPYHNSYYNPEFWVLPEDEKKLSKKEQIDAAMLRARDFAVRQYDSVKNYMKSIGVKKPIHIGETGWATISNGHYGEHGSRATDEYKQASYYNHIREWSNKEKVSCFYFEAFDEPWKDSNNAKGSENHFGLITVDGKAKYALWDLVDKNIFKGLTRDGNPITKTFNGNRDAMMQEIMAPPVVVEKNVNH